MQNKLTIIDGAMGTSLWNRIDDNSPVWMYNVEKPQEVLKLHREYVEAGAKIICANTFGANAPSVHKSDYSVEKVVREGVVLAKEAAVPCVRVALDIGTLPVLLEPYGDLSEEEAEEIFDEQIGAGVKENPDLIILETFIDIATIKIAAKVARKYDLPLFCSMSFEKKGRSMMGDSPTGMIEQLAEFSPDVIGLNCSLEPRDLLNILDVFIKNTDLPLFFKPNAGKPNYESGKAIAKTDAQHFAEEMMDIPRDREIYVGGCCGTTPEYISLLSEKLK